MGEIGLFEGIGDETGLVVGIGPVVGIGLFGGTGLVVSLTYLCSHSAKALRLIQSDKIQLETEGLLQ